MSLIDPLLHASRFPRYMQELEDILRAERAARERFYDDIREDEKAEFINGEVIVHSPARLEHIKVSDNLLRLLSTYVLKHHLGLVTHEKALTCLTRNDYEPDLAYFTAAHAAGFTKDQMKFPAPDLAGEILSPSTALRDRSVKFEDYAEHGVAEYWIVDAAQETIEQYLLEDQTYILAVKLRDGGIKSRALPNFEMPVRAAFDPVANIAALEKIIRNIGGI